MGFFDRHSFGNFTIVKSSFGNSVSDSVGIFKQIVTGLVAVFPEKAAGMKKEGK